MDVIKKWKRLINMYGQPNLHEDHDAWDAFHTEVSELSVELEAWAREAPEGHSALEYACDVFMDEDPKAHWCITADECLHVQKMADGESPEHRAEMVEWLENRRNQPPSFSPPIINWDDYGVKLWKSWEKGWSTEPERSMELLEALISPRSDYQILTVAPSMEIGSSPDDPIRFSFSAFVGETDIPLDVMVWASDLKLAIARTAATLSARAIKRGGVPVWVE